MGNRKSNIEKAKFKILQNSMNILKTSRFYESLSWPDPNKPRFLNIVLKVSSNLKPLDLLKRCKEIEINLGRKKAYKNAPRVCDIDIIDYDKKVFSDEINLPHPRMHSRNFVLIPLHEIDRNWIHPITKHHIKRLILSLSTRDITSIKQI